MAGFFDTNEDLRDGGSAGLDGGEYITKDEKRELINSGQPFKATAVKFEPGEGYEGADRYVVTIDLDEGPVVGDEERALTFNVSYKDDGVTPRVGSRDSRDPESAGFLYKLEKWLEDPANEPPKLKMTKIGRAQILVAAE